MDDRQENSDRLSNEVRPRCQPFDGVEIWSMTKPTERQQLGRHITSWLCANKHCSVVDVQISQSSDNAYHCVTVFLFWVKISQPFVEQHRTPAKTQLSRAGA